MNKNIYYQTDELPIDFFGSEDSYKTVGESEKDKSVYKSKKNCRFLPTQLMNLLPLIASQLLYTLFCSTLKSDGKGYFYPMTFKYIKMTEDDFDAALQTLIDNGIIDVTRIDERVYEYIVNYDKINDFLFPFKEMLNMEKIKLSTDITFRNIKDNSSNCDSTDLQLNELAMKLTSSERSKLMDMLMVLKAKEMNGEKI
ncbi:MAG: hypothetical protein MR695_06525 [Solobacterium sp.]|nr:hypothetical protein [Solobacterium sp.]